MRMSEEEESVLMVYGLVIKRPQFHDRNQCRRHVCMMVAVGRSRSFPLVYIVG